MSGNCFSGALPLDLPLPQAPSIQKANKAPGEPFWQNNVLGRIPEARAQPPLSRRPKVTRRRTATHISSVLADRRSRSGRCTVTHLSSVLAIRLSFHSACQFPIQSFLRVSGRWKHTRYNTESGGGSTCSWGSDVLAKTGNRKKKKQGSTQISRDTKRHITGGQLEEKGGGSTPCLTVVVCSPN